MSAATSDGEGAERFYLHCYGKDQLLLPLLSTIFVASLHEDQFVLGERLFGRAPVLWLGAVICPHRRIVDCVPRSVWRVNPVSFAVAVWCVIREAKKIPIYVFPAAECSPDTKIAVRVFHLQDMHDLVSRSRAQQILLVATCFQDYLSNFCPFWTWWKRLECSQFCYYAHPQRLSEARYSAATHQVLYGS